ncbi:MAG TPA: hypothetical protein VL282_06540 [Tepidisphaeraceae bacterium]|jgi:hypothetical protein|nr:hypothetical protein [Tepidisphaeraceae bacterium]
METRKSRGRTAHTVPDEFAPVKGRNQRSESNRPVGPGTGIHRGDRRDTSRPYTNNSRRQPNHGDPLGSGKKQIQGGGKARKGGGKREKGTYDH